MSKRYLALAAVIFTLSPLPLWADDAAEDKRTAEENRTAEDISARMQALETALATQQSRIDTLEAERRAADERTQAAQDEAQELKEQLAETRDSLDVLITDAMQIETRDMLSVYGFFDVTFLKSFFKQKNSLLKTQHPPYSTFMMNNINLFFKSELTQSLEVLLETGLSFAPLGHEKHLESYGIIDGKHVPGILGELDKSYERVDTSVPGGIASRSIRYGSISIVRAYLDWKPLDALNFRIGQYLTPYGIWNEDHASTVLLTVFYPHVMNWDLLPETQLGLQMYGSVFPADSLKLDYAVTFSNGRGPIDTVMDLDENKAVGLRAKGTWSHGDWKIALGGYGYYGKYTDLERRAEIYLNADLTPDETSGSALGSRLYTTKKYKERVLVSDLSIAWKGLHLFGEYAFRQLEFIKHPAENPDYQFVQNGNIAERYVPNSIGRTFYAMLSWTLPLEKWTHVGVTPYVGYDGHHNDFMTDWYYQKTMHVGLNVRPSPYVVVKTEGIVDLFSERLGGRMTSIAGQLAVSF